MLMFTSNYFRYLFQVNNNFVPLSNELGHIQDYLSIQNLRLSKSTVFETDIPRGCNDLDIPPLLLITFVENSVKHAAPPEDESLSVSLKCRITGEQRKMLEIVIIDNGQGFSDEVLEKLRNKESLSENGSHIGITNCIKRLELLYGDSFLLEVKNAVPHGAQITLQLPIDSSVTAE